MGASLGVTPTMATFGAKTVIVGDGAIGKTCILARLTNDSIDWDKDPEYEPTTFNNFKVTWQCEDVDVDLEIWDTAGQESFHQLRQLSYPQTDIFLVGYSTASNISLTNVEHKWLPEIKAAYEGGEPWVILVGTKCDIRENVSTADAEAVAKNINACLLIETSAKTEEGVEDLKAMITSLANEKHSGAPRPDWCGKAGLPEDDSSKDAKKKGKTTTGDDTPGCLCTIAYQASSNNRTAQS